jgi:SAM-dependent methyltransferase
MTNQPQTWHYGLVAQWWAEFNVATPDELAFYQGCIARFGQPALDLACGTGRLLIPLLRAGLDVDGCDISADMLAHCRIKAAQARLAPQLYAQAMHALDLPRQYRTIYICDSFDIGGQRQQDAEALRRCYHALAPVGRSCSTTTCRMPPPRGGHTGSPSSGRNFPCHGRTQASHARRPMAQHWNCACAWPMSTP